jgi:predicted ATP-dependent protease
MSLHAGALHRANGGYLILQAAELIRSPEAWQSLKRALRHREIRFHDFSLDPDKPRIYGSLRPKNTPMDQKLVLIGSVESYYRLMLEDEDFDRIFKIKAEFESWMPRDEEHELEFARFLRRVSEEEGFLPLHNSALARMIDEGSREVESQERMSTSITASLDLLCEADYWCRQEDRKEIRGEDIERALNGRESRHDSIARNIIESIEKGELLIDTDGWDVGQINGLLVYITQDHSFGVPTKITARTYAGKDGVINIDREAQLSGAIHDKSSMILVGLIGGLWGQNQPLHFNASITFEQLYGDIEGDSASCAEFYALLSSLSNTPIYQGIAVTGSINQQGLMQPIGSVNAKIEGMFKICKMRGLTGHQGVIIPEQNVNHLMLSDEVLEAVEAGTFHIWSIRHVYEGIDILMKSTMEPEENGTESKELVTLSEETKEIFGRVTDRINNFYDAAKEN